MNQPIPYGYCHCGCGGLTTVPQNDHSVHGYIKGVPIDFIMGHNSRGHLNPKWNGGNRIRSDGYVYLWIPGHPRSCKNYVMEHLVVAEKALGKPLPPKAEVHHIDLKRDHNENNNLVVCQDSAYHKLIHKRTKARAACGHADWDHCAYCKQYDDPKNLFVNVQGRAYHRACELDYQKLCRDRKRQEAPASRFIAEAGL